MRIELGTIRIDLEIVWGELYLWVIALTLTYTLAF